MGTAVDGCAEATRCGNEPRSEWAVNIHRDSFASYCGHHGTLSYFAVAENESIGRVKYNFMQVRARTGPVKTLGGWHTGQAARLEVE